MPTEPATDEVIAELRGLVSVPRLAAAVSPLIARIEAEQAATEAALARAAVLEEALREIELSAKSIGQKRADDAGRLARHCEAIARKALGADNATS